MLVGDDMDNWMANRMDDVDSLHVEIDNLNDPLARFCFIRDIDSPYEYTRTILISILFRHIFRHIWCSRFSIYLEGPRFDSRFYVIAFFFAGLCDCLMHSHI
jgi:hypothetical protein